MAENEDRPVKITQGWRVTSYDPHDRKWKSVPVVKAKQAYFDKLKPVKRDIWIEYIENGWLIVTGDLRKWLDDNGYKNVKQK